MSHVRIERALVTGASSGLGAEFARQLADRGVALTLVARREAALRALADELEVEVEVLVADLSEPSEVERVAARLRAGDVPIDLLVNNAGYGAYGAFTTLELDRQTGMVDLNVRSLVSLAHAAAVTLRDRGRGGIINVGSTAGFQPDPGGAVYGATKAFVRSLSEALHEELAAAGVRVLLLAPGVTETEFQQVSGMSTSRLPGAAVMSAQAVVAAALDDFSRGRAVCVPGWSNKLSAYGSQVTPSVLTRRLSKGVHDRFRS